MEKEWVEADEVVRAEEKGQAQGVAAEGNNINRY
jgi:hypothetical protein